MGNDSIDLSLKNVWESWFAFRRGKRPTHELEFFSYNLETKLWELYQDLHNGTYRHGQYHSFTVFENKQRTISVAGVRDRVVHRLLYQYLVNLYDKTFYFDVWSCRKNKGLVGGIERTLSFLRAYPKSFIWRADITKFFDHVNHKILIALLNRKINNPKALWLLEEVISSYPKIGQYERERERESNPLVHGIPIGNLTSQIFANIYLNELDRFVTHTIRPFRYLRYGDDFIVIGQKKEMVEQWRQQIIVFLKEQLKLALNPKSDIIIPAEKGLHFLGVDIFTTGRRLKKRNRHRAHHRLNGQNVSSYRGLIQKHENSKRIKLFDWYILQKLG